MVKLDRHSKEAIITALQEYLNDESVCIKIEEVNLDEIPEHYKTWGISKYSKRCIDISITFPKPGITNEEDEYIKTIFTRTQNKYLDD